MVSVPRELPNHTSTSPARMFAIPVLMSGMDLNVML